MKNNYKEDFIEYLETKTSLSEFTIRNYWRYIENYLDVYIKEHIDASHMSVFYTIDVNALCDLERQLLEREDLVELNRAKHGVYISTLRKYIEFAKTRL